MQGNTDLLLEKTLFTDDFSDTLSPTREGPLKMTDWIPSNVTVARHRRLKKDLRYSVTHCLFQNLQCRDGSNISHPLHDLQYA